MVDIAEQICIAVDKIVTEKIKSINFDTTITATIVDNRYAQQNQYTCSNGISQFIAYGKDTGYKINDSVQVTIPNNDYSQQKIITGRHVADTTVPYTYVQPFDTIIDITTNLVKEDGFIYSLLANDPESKELLIWSEIFEEKYSEFTRLGIQGQFRSWLGSLHPEVGEYGYKLKVFSSNGEDTQDSNKLRLWYNIYNKLLTNAYDEEEAKVAFETSADWVGEETIDSFKKKNPEEKLNWITNLLIGRGQISELTLSSYEMYGNPYNFQSFYEQEVVFDISELKNIIGMELYFYQEPGSFLDKDKKEIPYKNEDEGFGSGNFANNLFTKSPYVCLGYSLDEFNSEKAILYTLDDETYKIDDKIESKLNEKNIRLRWLHKFDDGRIKVVSEQNQLTNYEIKWYRFKLGAPSADEYSGVYWEEISEAHDKFSYVLSPRINTAEEQVKVVILYNEKIIRSNILTFQSEKESINEETLNFLSGLSIHCKDGTEGNYYIYGQNNNIIQENKHNEILTLEAQFNVISATNSNVESNTTLEATQIIWEFPYDNTMLVVHGLDYNALKSEKTSRLADGAIVKLEGNSIIITREKLEDGTIINTQDYRIKKTYSATSTNNIIKCSIVKNSLIYSATKEMSFGIMGTNGTDATLVIDFENNKTALNADSADSLEVVARLYDYNHKEIDLNNLDLGLEFNWEWFDSEGIDSIIKENKGNRCYLSTTGELDLLNKVFFLILKFTLTNFGNYPLVTYKAIPIRANAQYRNMIGPTEIIYNSTGYADYYKRPFELWYCEKSENINLDYVKDWTQIKDGLKWEIYNPFKEEEKYIGKIENDILKPAQMFVKGVRPYGVIARKNEPNGEIYWIQPLVILQNNYPSTTINQWDGEGLEILDEGVILTNALAAGKKNEDNTFSGVMLGDWKENTDTSSDITSQTGIYGFHKGAMSYAFKEDGTAFIGKSGYGRILFDGNKGVIASEAWKIDPLNVNIDLLDTNKNGMSLDLDEGSLRLQGFLTSENASEYKLLNSQISEEKFDSYFVQIRAFPLSEKDNEENYKNALYKPIEFIGGNEGSSRFIKYFYTYDEEKEEYIQQEEFDEAISKNKGYYFPMAFEFVPKAFWPTRNLGFKGYYDIRNAEAVYEKTKYIKSQKTGIGLNVENFANKTYIREAWEENGKEYKGVRFYTLSDRERGYITLSAAEPTYPLSIGKNYPINSRNFLVRWDGSVFISSPNKSGYNISLDSSTGTITGGLIEGATVQTGVLSSSEGGIKLDGYLTVGGGELGFTTSNIIDGEGNLTSAPGIGMSSGNSYVKATEANVGMSFNLNQYISLTSKGVSIGGSTLNVIGIDAKDQFGIYARFA